MARLRTADGRELADGTLDAVPAADARTIREAAMFCPPEAIEVWDEETGEKLFP